MLARKLLGIGLWGWGGALLFVLGFGVFLGASLQYLLGYFTAMCALLIFLAWPLRDHARNPGTRYGVTIALMLPAGIAGTIAFLNGGQYWVWAVFLTISLLFIGRRYRAMMSAPPAFPARRMQVA